MRYNFTARWYRPDGSEPQSWELGGLSISDRILSLGNLNSSVGDPSQLFAFTSPDLQVTMNNQDGFWTNEIKNQTAPARVTDANSRYQFELTRDGVQLFRGHVLLTSFDLDRKNRTVTFTALGPMRLCDQKSAEGVKRTFPTMTIISPGGANTVAFPVGTSSFPISLNWPEIFAGDIVSLRLSAADDSDGDEYVVSGVSGNTIYTVEAASKDYPHGTIVTVATPWYRNAYIGDNTRSGLVGSLFEEAGIGTYDIRYTGLTGTSAFFSNLNTTGTEGYGRLVRLNQIHDTALSGDYRLYASFAFDGPDGYGTRYASSHTSGFFSGYPSLANGIIGGEIYAPGGFCERTDYGVEYATTVTPPVQILADSFECKTGDDLVEFFGTQPVYKSTWDVIVRRFAVAAPGTNATSRMYELRFTGNVLDDFADTGSQGRAEYSWPYHSAVKQWDVELYRYTTTNRGETWTLDTTFHAPFAQPSATPSPANSRTISYVIGAYRTNPSDGTLQFIKRSAIRTIANGPTTWGQVDLTWSSVAGATDYRVWRIVDGESSTFRTGLVVQTTSTSTSDVGQISDYSSPPDEYCYQVGGAFGQSSDVNYAGPTYPFSISCLPFAVGSLVTDNLVISTWNGSIGTTYSRQLREIRVASTIVTSDLLHHYNAGESKVMVAEDMDLYTTERAICFFVAYGGDAGGIGGPSIANQQFRATSGIQASVSTIPTGSWVPFMRTMKWNGLAGSQSRVALFAGSEQDGTGVAILTPGQYNESTGFNYSFGIEDFAILDKSFKPYSSQSGPVVPTTGQFYSSTHCFFRRQIGEFATDRDTGSLNLAPWRLTIGGTTATVFVGYGANRWFIYSNRHTGYINLADFEGLSITAALQELAFIVNATVSVEYRDASGAVSTLPHGKFIGRDLQVITTETPKVLMNTDGTNPPGANQALLIDVDDTRVWNQTYSQVTVTGVPDDVTATAGSLDFQKEGLDVSARFVDTKSFAQAIADNLLTYYGPAESGVLQTPRQAATVTVWDDGTIYTPRKVVRFPDAWNTPSPLAGEDRFPLAWWVESVDVNPTEPTVRLSVVQRDIP